MKKSLMADILDKIPEVLQYFIPGFVMLSLFTALSHKKIETTAKTIISCVISFVVTSGVQAYFATNNDEQVSGWIIVFWALIISTAIGLLGGFMVRCSWLEKILQKTLNISLSSNVLQDEIRVKQNQLVKLIIKNEKTCIIGHVSSFDPHDPSGWISITNYCKKDIKSEDIVVDMRDDDAIICVSLNEVSSIDIINFPKEKKSK